MLSTDVRAAYEALAPRYEDVLGNSYSIKPEIFDAFFAKLPIGSLLLDAGCGPGFESGVARTHALHPVGFDISSAMIARYQKRLPESDAQVGDIAELPFADATFDSVLCACALLHLPRPRAILALSEFRRVCKPYAPLLLCTSIGTGDEWHERLALSEAGVETLYFHHWPSEDLRTALNDQNITVTAWNEYSLVQDRPNVAFIEATANP